jgi:hypothetical protein
MNEIEQQGIEAHANDPVYKAVIIAKSFNDHVSYDKASAIYARAQQQHPREPSLPMKLVNDYLVEATGGLYRPERYKK